MPWIYKAFVLLVIACPCAPVILTPMTVVSALTAAARMGILIKGGLYLEEGGKVRSRALDDGYDRAGIPVVTDVSTVRRDAGDWLQLAASLADRSDHPVSTAASPYWPEHAGSAPVSAVTLRATLLDQWAAQTISIVSHQTFQFDDTTAM